MNMSLSTTSNEHSRRARSALVELKKDNDNQDEWLRSVRTYARAHDVTQLTMRQGNQYRTAKTTDLSERGVLSVIKKEAADQDDDAEPEGKEMFIDEGEMDDYERLMYDGLVIFQDLHGADESETVTSKRFKFSFQLQLSAPHHRQKLEESPPCSQSPAEC